MPVIATTSCRKLEDYRQSVLHGGGDVRVVDPSVGVTEALAGADGLLLTGGEDVSPARYRESPHATVVDVDRAGKNSKCRRIAEGPGGVFLYSPSGRALQF